MTPDDEILFDQLDRYQKGILPEEERLLLETQMNTDASFRQKVNEHLKFMKVLRQYGNHTMLQTSLDVFHEEMRNEKYAQGSVLNSTTSSIHIRKYWPTVAVAASVALLSVVGTLIATESLEKKQEADYHELRKNVEQIKKSQKAIMADIREVKEKDVLPGNYEGTGFLISNDGYVATSYHVIRDADSLYLENNKFGRLRASVVKADRKNDIAILKIEKLFFRTLVPYTIRVTESSIGENVFTLGFPREDIVYGEGTISSSTGYRNNTHAYQIAVPVNPGNSGGPLLNAQGQLVGIISGVQTEMSGAAFAVKSSVLLEVIGHSQDSLALPIRLPKQNRLRDLNRIDQVRRLQDFVLVVKVYNSK